MVPFAHASALHIRKTAALIGGTHQRRLVLVAMASMLLLSGCMLSPLFQAPAALMTGVAVLLGLAACGSGGGGGGGSTPEGTGPYTVNVNSYLAGDSTRGFVLQGKSTTVLPQGATGSGFSPLASIPIGNTYGDGFGFSLATGVVQNEGGVDLIIGAPLTRYGSSHPGGAAWVVFGNSNMRHSGAGANPVDIQGFESGGEGGPQRAVIYSQSTYDRTGFSVAVAANARGDGVNAVLAGMPGA
ncbi:MAG TPA: integrin alpha, partial [bacterium]